jgi:DNA-binding NtrC family response regulator
VAVEQADRPGLVPAFGLRSVVSDARGNGAGSILCVAPMLQDRAEMAGLVRLVGRAAETAATLEEALERLAEHPCQYCLLLLDGTPASIRTVRAIRSRHPATAIIGVVDPNRTDQLPEALRVGVFDVALRPLTGRDLEALLSNARQQGELASAGVLTPVDVTPWGVFGASRAMRDVMALIRLAAPKKCGVFVCGERGTGHEMVARAIHAYGPSSHAPFVTVNCATTSPQDLERDLFGTFGTSRRRVRGGVAGGGRPADQVAPASAIARAAGGTLFLEHLPEMPEPIQQRLVRVLRDRQAVVGNDRGGTAADIRPIAAAELPLLALDEAGVAPELHERLSLIRIELPPLRERREDIPALAAHFLKEICRAEGQPPKTLTHPALTLLSALAWRGNARELRTLLERLVILVPQGIIRLEDVLTHTRIETSIAPLGAAATLREARARFEREYVASVVQQHRGRMTEAAEVLGIQRTNLYRKMRRLNLMPSRRPSRSI